MRSLCSFVLFSSENKNFKLNATNVSDKEAIEFGVEHPMADNRQEWIDKISSRVWEFCAAVGNP